MTLTEHEQRLLDQQSGAAMDRRAAVRSELLREHRRLMQSENLGPADELAGVREELRRLEVREKALREILLTQPDARMGNRFVAEIVTVEKQRTDYRELKRMHPDIIEQYTFPATEQHVRLSGVTEDGEPISLREMRRALATQEAK